MVLYGIVFHNVRCSSTTNTFNQSISQLYTQFYFTIYKLGQRAISYICRSFIVVGYKIVKRNSSLSFTATHFLKADALKKGGEKPWP